MKTNHLLLVKTLAIILCAGGLVTQSASAKGGATDPIPGTSKSGVITGGGSSKKTTTTSTPATTPTAPAPVVQPIVTAPLNFTAAAQVNGVIPQCTGAYRIDPYYPMLSLLTVDVQAGSINVPDGTPLYLQVNGVGGTLYPFTSNVLFVVGQSGSCSYSEYITPGTTIQSVVVTDASGNIIAAGN